MSPRPPARRTLLGLGLDGKGTGPASADGATRVTQGEDYLLLGGGEEVHGAMQDVAECVAQACRAEGTTLGQAPKGLIAEILAELGGPPEPGGRRLPRA